MKRLLTASIVALLVAGLTAPLVMAKEDGSPSAEDHRAERQEMRDQRIQDHRGDRLPGERGIEHMSDKSRRVHGGYNVTISASGVDQDNQSYTIDGVGRGIGVKREANNTTKAVMGFAILNVTLKDANGSIIKQGLLRVRFMAHQNETGAWHWGLISVARGPFGFPALLLHGDNVTIGDGHADLQGAGFALVKKSDDRPRLRIKLDAEVQIEKQ